MKPHKVSDAKSTAKQATYNRVPGRDYHSQKQVATSKEGAKSKDGKRAK